MFGVSTLPEVVSYFAGVDMYVVQTINAVTNCNNGTPAGTGSSYFSGAPHLSNCNAYVGLENGFAGRGDRFVDNEFETRGKWKTKGSAEPKNLEFGELQNNKNFNVSENDEEKEKKRDKKWSIGGLFKRKSKREEDDSSDDYEDEGKKGFLSRQKSKREQRQVRVRNTAAGFDVVIPHAKKDQRDEMSRGSAARGETGRFICRNRHPSTAIDERVSSNSRGIGGGESFDGRKTRKGVLARAEAKRDLIHNNESSSDEDESYHSNASAHKGALEDRSVSRRRRVKRTLPRDVGSAFRLNENEFRMAKSDLEGNRQPLSLYRFTLTSSHTHFNGQEGTSASLTNRSTQSDFLRSSSACERDAGFHPMSTFPPAAHHIQPPGQWPSSRGRASTRFRNESLENRSSHRLAWPRPDGKAAAAAAAAAAGDLPANSLTGWHSPVFPMEKMTGKSLSYDVDIHKSFQSSSNLSLETPLSTRPYPDRPLSSHSSAGHCTRVQSPVRMNANGSRTAINSSNSAYENLVGTEAGGGGNAFHRNRTDSLSTQSGISPRSPMHVSNGISFFLFNGDCDSSRPLRSHSCQHLPIQVSSSDRPFSDRVNTEEPFLRTLSITSDNSMERCWARFEVASDRVRNGARTHLESSADERTKETVRKFPPIREAPVILRYYADQNPRSRNPIHITCNPACGHEQSYLSDSQIMPKALGAGVKEQMKNASECWKTTKNENYDETMLKITDESEPNRRLTQHLTGSKNVSISEREKEINSPGNDAAVRGYEWNGKKSVEDGNGHGPSETPPKPPVRRLSKSEVLERLHKCEAFTKMTNDTRERIGSSSRTENLDEALHELEVIYNSLRLKDDELTEPENFSSPCHAVPLKATKASLCSGIEDGKFGCQVSIPLSAKRSAVSGKISDDMAYRRMNAKDRRDVKVFPAQSYLRSSPALSPVSGGNPPPRRESPVAEPDITRDDMVFRNIRHANSTLRITDPQPPFGIPIGVIAPAPNSDYLHATPKRRFRPTFKSSKTPDVVKDDLAYRNLRKDNQTKAVPLVQPADGSNALKKRAVRSLSANIHGLVEHGIFSAEESPKGGNRRNAEKAQSLVNLTGEDSGERRRILQATESRDAIKNAGGKKAELTEALRSAERFGKSDDEKMSFIARLGNGVTRPSESENSFKWLTNSALSSPVVKLSKFPAAAPAASSPSNPFNEVSAWTSSVDEEELDNLLSALASQAINTSKDLAKQLDELDSGKYLAAVESSSDAAASVLNDVRPVDPGLVKKKRRRNLSLPAGDESAGDVENTGSLDRVRLRKQKEQSQSEVAALKASESGAAKATALFQSDDPSYCGGPRPGPGFRPPLDGKSETSDSRSDFRKPVPPAKGEAAADTLRTDYEYNNGRPSKTAGKFSVPEFFGGFGEKVSPTSEEPQMDARAQMIAIAAAAAAAAESAKAGAMGERESEDPARASGFQGRSDREEGELTKGSSRTELWLACAYELAFAFHLQEVDSMTALGFILAVVLIVAILIF